MIIIKQKKYLQIIKKDFYIITISFNFHCFHKTVCQRQIVFKKEGNYSLLSKKSLKKSGKKGKKKCHIEGKATSLMDHRLFKGSLTVNMV